MSTEKIDKYIAGKADWAQPLLSRIREVILKGNPDIKEDWKWGGPAFTRQGIVCMLWGFKSHVSITFYHGALLTEETMRFDPCVDENQHNRAIRFEAEDKIPTRVISNLASKNNENGIVLKKKSAKKKSALVSADFAKELKRNRAIGRFFEGLALSYKALYTDWINGAKREETMKTRIQRAIARLKDAHKQPSC